MGLCCSTDKIIPKSTGFAKSNKYTPTLKTTDYVNRLEELEGAYTKPMGIYTVQQSKRFRRGSYIPICQRTDVYQSTRFRMLFPVQTPSPELSGN